MPRRTTLALALAALLAGCDRSPAQTQTEAEKTADARAKAVAAAKAAGVEVDAPKAAADGLVKLSQHGDSLYCSLAQTPDGAIHAIYTDGGNATHDGVKLLWYRSTKDDGATWSDPTVLSDEADGLNACYCRAVVDARGRLYAIWKDLTNPASETLDGPGSAGGGKLSFRVLEGGKWSPPVALSTVERPSTSFFATLGGDGKVHVVFAANDPDYDWRPWGGLQCQFANWIRHATLDGAAAPAFADVIAPTPPATPGAQPRDNGLWNLRGYVAADGKPRFTAEHFNLYSSGGANNDFFVYFDGTKLTKLFDVGDGLNLNNPPTLVADAAGNPHLIRVAEKTSVVRDEAIEGGKLGAPTQVTPGSVGRNWQVTPLGGGEVAVTTVGGAAEPDGELWLTLGNGRGKWIAPVCVTANETRATFESARSVTGGSMTSSSYAPRFADAVRLKDGHVAVLMVNEESTSLGIVGNVRNSSGRIVEAMGSTGVVHPWVFFRKL